jgi:hypothetical protein
LLFLTRCSVMWICLCVESRFIHQLFEVIGA